MRTLNVDSLVIAMMLTFGAACSGNAITDAIPPLLSEESAYWSLTANYRAVNLALEAPYNTVQLDMTPRNAYGAPIPFEGRTPIYTVRDTVKLSITEDGIVTAKGTGANIMVLASLQIGTITHVDTILVTVTPTPPATPLTTFSIQPVPPDSSGWSYGGGLAKTIRPVAKNATTGNITNLQVRYKSSDPRIATVVSNGATNGKMTGIAIGKVWITASTYAYGVYKSDSVEFLIGYPAEQIVSVDRIPGANGDDVAFYPPTVTIGVGGQVNWDLRGQWINVQGPGIVFDEPDKAKGIYPPEICQNYYALLWDVCGGNSAPRSIYREERGLVVVTSRTWSEPGVYTYHDHWGKRSGKVIVLSRPNL